MGGSMIAMSRNGGAVALLIWFAGNPGLSRAEDPPHRLLAGAPLQRIVLRVSEEWLSARLDRRIDKVTPVDQVVLGTRVVGQARIVGRPRLELRAQEEIASFDVIFSGTTVSRTVGNPGPVTIRSRSETSFTASKRVLFESGKGFYTLPAKINTQTRVVTEGVSAQSGWADRPRHRAASLATNRGEAACRHADRQVQRCAAD